MKYLNGEPIMKGDVALAKTPDGTVVGGTVHQLIDRSSQFYMSGYPLRVNSSDALLASTCYNTLADALANAAQEAAKKAAQEAANSPTLPPQPPAGTQMPPKTPNAP
jgi:hypothetical protein